MKQTLTSACLVACVVLCKAATGADPVPLDWPPSSSVPPINIRGGEIGQPGGVWIQVRRGTTNDLVDVLAQGVLVYDTTTDRLRVGDGVTVGGVPIGIDAMPGETGLIKYSEGTPEGGLSGVVGDIAVDAVNGAGYIKQSGNHTTTGWDLIKTEGNSATAQRYVNNTQVRSQALDDQITNGTFTGSATPWSLGGGWTYASGTNNVYITGGVISGAVLSQTITEVHSGSEYMVGATIGGFAANEEVVVTFVTGTSTITLGTYSAPTSMSEPLTIPEIGTSSFGFLNFTLSNSSGTAATYIDDVTMTLTRECLRQTPIATYWPAGTLTQIGDGGRAVWRGGVDAGTPQFQLIMADSAGNESSLWTWTAPASGDFELTADFVYSTTAAGRWAVRMLQHQQDVGIDNGTFVNVTWASEGAQLLLLIDGADNNVRIDWSDYITIKTP